MYENPTGLRNWADKHGTTPQEIKILLDAEAPGSSAGLLGPSIDGPEPINAGRGTALAALLQRGRAKLVTVPLATVAAEFGISEDEAGNAAAAAGANPRGGAVPSNYLPGIVTVLTGGTPSEPPEPGTGTLAGEAPEAAEQAPEVPEAATRAPEVPEAVTWTPEVPEAGPANETDVPAADGAQGAPEPPAPKAAPAKPAAKPATPKRRKTKYSLSKQAAMEIFAPVKSDVPVREIRAFLLTVPGTKPADVAMMTDDDVRAAFGSDYVSLPAGNGALILAKPAYDGLLNLLSTTDAYFVPAALPKEEADA